jgi:hypothetical protein
VAGAAGDDRLRAEPAIDRAAGFNSSRHPLGSPAGMDSRQAKKRPAQELEAFGRKCGAAAEYCFILHRLTRNRKRTSTTTFSVS